MSAFPRRYSEIDTIHLNNITIRGSDNSIPPDGYILTASTGRTHMLSPTFALDSIPGLSDLSGRIANLLANSAARKIVGTNEIAVGGATPTAAGMIVSTFISTNGYLNVFENTTGTTANIELKLSTLGIWPNNPYDTMRFSHYGNANNVQLYAEDSTYTDGLLATIAPGDTFSFIYKGTNNSFGDNTRISTMSYYKVQGY